MKKRTMLSLGLVIMMALGALVFLPETGDANECRIVRVIMDKGSTGQQLRIEPEITHVRKGACIVWINWVPTSEIRINFTDDGKRCMDATDAAVNFKSAENCFLTDYIKLGGTSSLRFVDAGTFEFHVEVPDTQKQTAAGPLSVAFGTVQATGKIVVIDE